MKILTKYLIPIVVLSVLYASHAVAKPAVTIHVSILPHKYLVDRIAGDLAETSVLVKPGKSPATYAPTPSQIKKLSRADLYFRTGVPFENGFMHKIESIAKDIRIVDLRNGIRLREMGEVHHQDDPEVHDQEADHHDNPDHNVSEHSDHHGHGHTGKDPHIWMSPALFEQQAKTVLEALKAINPENKATYQKQYALFISELKQLQTRMATALGPYQGETIFVFHPVFGYFADDYKLHQVAVETMGRAPKGKDLAALIKLAKKKKARVIFVQPQFDQNAARKIATAIKGHVISIDPLEYDYLKNMKTITGAITTNLKR